MFIFFFNIFNVEHYNFLLTIITAYCLIGNCNIIALAPVLFIFFLPLSIYLFIYLFIIIIIIEVSLSLCLALKFYYFFSFSDLFGLVKKDCYNLAFVLKPNTGEVTSDFFICTLFLVIQMSTRFLHYLKEDKLARYSAGCLVCSTIAQLIRLLRLVLRSKTTKHKPLKHQEDVSSKDFWSNFHRLLKVCFPSFTSPEFLGMVLECYLIFLRASITIKTAQTISLAGRHLVNRKKDLLVHDLVDMALLAIPGTVAHVGVWYVRSFVSGRMKDNLYQRLAKLYFSGNNLYHITSSGFMDNPERRFVEDSIKFCNTFMNLFESLLAPVVNVVTLSYELSKGGGISAPGLIISYYLLAASVKSLILPDFSALMATAHEREAKLRTAHNVLVQHAEEVAFYGGEEREKEHTEELINSIVENEYKVKRSKWMMSLFDSIVLKYGSAFVGFVVCGIVVQEQSKKGEVDTAVLTQLYFKTSHLCMPFLKALGKLLMINLKLAAIVGSVQRVSELREVLLDVGQMNESDEKIVNDHYLLDQNFIEFSHANIVTPTQKCLIEDFSVRVVPNTHVLIRGKNGSGKSAIIRALAGLWPISQGTITVPSYDKLYIVPQRVYLPPGSLKRQLTYPMDESTVSDAVLLKFAELVGLDPVIERVGGLQAEENWQSVLSGGERQRVSLVRVLVHRPQFAILDECTSAVSADDERGLYLTLQQAGITLLTISHRDSLKELHDIIIEIDDNGGYRLTNKKNDSGFSPLGFQGI
eukprot:gene11929-8209_t